MRNRLLGGICMISNATAAMSRIPPEERKAPALHGVFKKQYLRISGLPANDERVARL